MVGLPICGPMPMGNGTTIFCRFLSVPNGHQYLRGSSRLMPQGTPTTNETERTAGGQPDAGVTIAPDIPQPPPPPQSTFDVIYGASDVNAPKQRISDDI